MSATASMVETDLPVTTIARHYGAQLEAASWSLQEEEEADSMMRGTWRFVDEQGDVWLGLLLVARVSGQPQRHLAYLQAEWDE